MAKHQKKKSSAKIPDAAVGKHASRIKHAQGQNNDDPTPARIIELARSSKSAEEIKDECERANPFEENAERHSKTYLERPDLLDLPSISQRLPVITDTQPHYGPKGPIDGKGRHEAVKRPEPLGKHSKEAGRSSGKSKGKHTPKNSSAHSKESARSSSGAVRKASKRKKKLSKRKLALLISGGIALCGIMIGCSLLILSLTVPEIDPEVALESMSVDVPEDHTYAEMQQRPIDSGATEGSIEAMLDRYGTYEVTARDIASLPSTMEPFAFALDEGDYSKPKLSSSSKKQIEDIAKRITDAECDVSYLLVDMNSGRGIAGNIDKKVYGASSFKGIYCAYYCEDADNSGRGLEWNKSSIESIILYSDNNSYDSMRASQDASALKGWLANIGIEGDDQLANDWYPFQSARTSATAWIHVNDYLNSGTENAKWLKGLFEKTNVSFIRDGINDKDAVVLNKAGWYAASYGDLAEWNGTCDAGIIEYNGHTYLMSVMTSLPTSDKASKAVSDMVSALWEARKDLVTEDETL